MKLIEPERFDERLLGQCLGGEDRGGAGRAGVALWGIEQDDFLNAPEFVEEPFHRQASPRGLRVAIDRLQEGEAEQA